MKLFGAVTQFQTVQRQTMGRDEEVDGITLN